VGADLTKVATQRQVLSHEQAVLTHAGVHVLGTAGSMRDNACCARNIHGYCYLYMVQAMPEHPVGSQ
jgi:hypothetical protein